MRRANKYKDLIIMSLLRLAIFTYALVNLDCISRYTFASLRDEGFHQKEN